MNTFSTKSAKNLRQAHPELQRLFKKVLERVDCSILTGYRGERAQNSLFRQGKSKLQFPNSNHNVRPSKAVDVAPYPIPKDWDARQFYYFAGQVQTIADQMKIKVRWGGDWDGDGDVTDQTFNDLVHWEIV